MKWASVSNVNPVVGSHQRGISKNFGNVRNLIAVREEGDRSHRTDGFTLVELLIVIVIIAILAAITIIAYNGITDKAHAAVLESDLSNGRTTLGIYSSSNGNYPADQPTAVTAGLKASSGDVLTYTVNGNGYCLQASGWSQTYYVTGDISQPVSGTCPDAGTTVPNAWAQYNFTGGSVTDSSGNGNNLTYIGGTLETTTDRLGGTNNALLFDTNSGYAYTPEVNNPQVFSINVWFKTAANQYGNGGVLVGFNDDNGGGNGGGLNDYDRILVMDSAGKLGFGVWDDTDSVADGTETNTSYNDGAWHMATVTFDGTSLSLYVDGTLEGSAAAPHGAQQYNGYWLIGEDDLNGWDSEDGNVDQGWYEGDLDDVSLYTSALTSSQVSALYSQG